MAEIGTEGLGLAWQAWLGVERYCKARYGKAG
jgi:hypothetical protein